MTFLLLSMQSLVCVTCVLAAKKTGVISFLDFDIQDAKAWYPISCLLVSVIYTGSKSLVSTAKQDIHTTCADGSRISNTSAYPFTQYSKI